MVAACSFDGSNRGAPGAVSDSGAQMMADASVDAAPDANQVCVPNLTACVGNTLETCLADGFGFDSLQTQICDFACVVDQCVGVSNVSSTDLALCSGNFLPLTPGPLTSVDIGINNGTPEIRCTPHCGDGITTSIPAVTTIANVGVPNLALFCLSTVNIPAGRRVNTGAAVDVAIAFVVEGTVTIDGGMSFEGKNAADGVEGAPGAGGGRGAAEHTGADLSGEGSCPGHGGLKGKSAGGDDDNIGGGGGGAGHGGGGGAGRPGITNDDQSLIAGGAGGGQCGASSLIPLSAGSGGGAGGDGACGPCGWAGGGGGGALQISSKVSIVVSGTIAASGGAGFFGDPGDPQGGGGGGGSGGGVLLEAPTVDVTGAINVNGGNAAASPSSAGGQGGIGATLDGALGEALNGPNEAGVGGGGGGGRVRLNAATPATCAGVSPTVACTSGTMIPQ